MRTRTAGAALAVALVAVMLLKVGMPGAPGGVMSEVVNDPELVAPALPAASLARTSTV